MVSQMLQWMHQKTSQQQTGEQFSNSDLVDRPLKHSKEFIFFLQYSNEIQLDEFPKIQLLNNQGT